MSQFYIDRNGRAQIWDLDHQRLELARWIFHHPEGLWIIIEKLQENGIDFPPAPSSWSDITILIEGINSLTDQEIDAITGVNLDG